MDTSFEEGFYLELGARVRRHRQRVGLSQAQLAAPLGLTRASITNLEAGRQRPQVHQLAKLADALGTEPSELLPSLTHLSIDRDESELDRAMDQARAAASRL